MLVYIKPEYKMEIGDCCRLIQTEGEEVINKKIQTVIKNLYIKRYLDFISIRNLSTRILNQSNLVPLYLSHNEVLIPVKVRQAIIARDGCYGYVNIASIKSVDKNCIHMIDGSTINYCENERSLKRRLKMAKLLREHFEKDRNFPQLQASNNKYNDIILGLNCLKSTFAGCNINVDIRIGTGNAKVQECVIPLS